MVRPLIIKGWENKTDFRIIPEKYQHPMKYLEQCIALGKNEEHEMLGLHKKGNSFAPGNYIGMIWLDKGYNQAVLRADSKFPDMDYVAMYAKCAAHPIVGDRLNDCFHVWPEQDLIDTDEHDDFTILGIIAYLRELNNLCRRHMRRHFIRTRQNFVGKMKGKIIISENIQRNVIPARPDRIYCEYQSVSDDILENQILRTALECAARHFAEYRGNKSMLDILPQWIRASRAALNGVSTKKIKPSDFVAARKRGAFAFYKRPLVLAKAVLQKLGPNPQTEIPQTQTPPFSLNSSKLFEHYAQIKLSEKIAGIQRGTETETSDAGDFNAKVCPDFYVEDKQKPRIIDAKYKDVDSAYFTDMEITDNKRKPRRDDIYQVVSYSQHRGLLKKMDCADSQSIALGLAYPYISDDIKSVAYKKQTYAFLSKLTIYGIPCPAKKKPKTTGADNN